MAPKRSRYKEMELAMTVLLLANAVVFILYLIVASVGILWLKAITSVFALILSGLCLVYLYLSKELLRQRSLWLTAGYFGIFLCTLVSLLVNFPAPAIS